MLGWIHTSALFLEFIYQNFKSYYQEDDNASSEGSQCAEQKVLEDQTSGAGQEDWR